MLRPATPADHEQITAVTAAGFATYRSFAPAGWEPPADMTGDGVGERLESPHAYGIVATDGDAIVGFGAFEAARERPREGALIEGLAHVWAVFVAPSHWGTSTASEVLRALTEEMGRRGFFEARLFTPAGQARARRFYEREGWSLRGAPFAVPELGLDLVELRRPIQPGG